MLNGELILGQISFSSFRKLKQETNGRKTNEKGDNSGKSTVPEKKRNRTKSNTSTNY